MDLRPEEEIKFIGQPLAPLAHSQLADATKRLEARHAVVGISPQFEIDAAKPDCKVSAIVDGKPAKVDGWKGSAGTRFVRVADASGCIVAMLVRKRKFLERQLASYDAVIANPLAVIPLHDSEVK